MDLQKSLEVMRFVIMRENQRLRDKIQQMQEQLADVRRQALGGAMAGSQAAPVASSLGGCTVEWRLELAGGRLAPSAGGNGRHEMATERCELAEFTLPQMPGIGFVLRFFPTTSECPDDHGQHSAAARQSNRQQLGLTTLDSCALTLDVIGPDFLQSMELQVALSILVGEQPLVASAQRDSLIRVGGRLRCSSKWPCGATLQGQRCVVCRVDVIGANARSTGPTCFEGTAHAG